MNRHEVGQQTARIPLAEGQWTALLFFEPGVVPISVGIPTPLPPFIDVGLTQQAGQLAGPRGAPLTKATKTVRLKQVYAASSLRITFYAAEEVCERIRADQAAKAAAVTAAAESPPTLRVVRDPESNGHAPPA
jgi:hypothetical protein